VLEVTPPAWHGFGAFGQSKIMMRPRLGGVNMTARGETGNRSSWDILVKTLYGIFTQLTWSVAKSVARDKAG